MINRFKQLFAADAAAEPLADRDQELQLAASALLVEQACSDGDFDADERASIAAILKSEFDLNEDETRTMIEEAEQAVFHGFRRFEKELLKEYIRWAIANARKL